MITFGVEWHGLPVVVRMLESLRLHGLIYRDEDRNYGVTSGSSDWRRPGVRETICQRYRSLMNRCGGKLQADLISLHLVLRNDPIQIRDICRRMLKQAGGIGRWPSPIVTALRSRLKRPHRVKTTAAIGIDAGSRTDSLHASGFVIKIKWNFPEQFHGRLIYGNLDTTDGRMVLMNSFLKKNERLHLDSVVNNLHFFSPVLMDCFC